MTITESRAKSCFTNGPITALSFVEQDDMIVAISTSIANTLSTATMKVGTYSQEGIGAYLTTRGSMFEMAMTRKVWQMKCEAFWGMK